MIIVLDFHSHFHSYYGIRCFLFVFSFFCVLVSDDYYRIKVTKYIGILAFLYLTFLYVHMSYTRNMMCLKQSSTKMSLRAVIKDKSAALMAS